MADSPDLTHQIAPLTGGKRLSKERLDAVIAKIVDRKKTSFAAALMFVFVLKKTAEKRASRLRDVSAVLKAALRVRDDPRLEEFFKTSLFDFLGCDLKDEYDDLPVKDRRASEFLIAAHIMYTLFLLKAGLFKPGVVGEIRQGEAVVRRGQNLDKAYARDLRNNVFDAFRKGWLRDDNSGACYDKIGAIGEHVARARLPKKESPSARLGVAVEITHFTSLLIDDFIDQDRVRRNETTFHEFLKAGGKTLLHQSGVISGICFILLEALRNFLLDLDIPARKKQSLLKHHNDHEQLVAVGFIKELELTRLGTAYQIRDDIIDLFDEDFKQRPMGSDIRENKPNVLTILALLDKNLERRALFIRFFEQSSKNPKTILFLKNLLKTGRVLDRAMGEYAAVIGKAEADLEALKNETGNPIFAWGGCAALSRFVEKMKGFTAS